MVESGRQIGVQFRVVENRIRGGKVLGGLAGRGERARGDVSERLSVNGRGGTSISWSGGEVSGLRSQQRESRRARFGRRI